MKRIFILLSFLCMSQWLIAGSGGPDAYGYTWIDSDDINGPAYTWVDIEIEAYEVKGLGDDNYVGHFDILGGFAYYWYTLDKIYIGSNGFISADGINIASPFDLIPTASGANNFIAPLLTDLDFANTGGTPKCYFRDNLDSTVISWLDVPFWNVLGSVNSFQIILDKQDSSITFNYKDQQGASLSNVEIGIEDITGTIGLEVSTFLPAPNYSVRFEYPDTVTYAITDGSAQWNHDHKNGGVFIPNLGTSRKLEANIKNVGNQTFNSFLATGTVYDDLGGVEVSSIVNGNALDPGEDTTINYPASFNATGPGTYSFETLLSNITGDVIASNDLRTQEIVVVDTTQAIMNLSFTDNSPLGGVAWQGGDGGVAVYFKPPFYPVRVLESNYLINSNLNNFGFFARIYDDNGVDGGPGTLLDSVYVNSSQVNIGTNTVVPVNNSIVLNNGGIYVEWYMEGDGIEIATDLDPPFSFQGYEVLSSIWSNYRDQESADFFISVDIEPFVIRDATVTDIENPADGSNITQQDTVRAWFKNLGDADISLFNLNYQLEGGTVNSQLYNGPPVSPGDSARVQFNLPVFSGRPNLDLCVWTSLTGDDDRSNDTLCILLNPSEPGDLGVTDIISPVGGTAIPDNTTVTIAVENFGATDAGLFKLFYNKGGSIVSELYLGDPLPGGQSMEFTFATTINSSAPGESFCAWTDKADDTNQDNDTLCIALHTGTGDIPGNPGMAVYPNPFGSRINLEVNATGKQSGWFNLYNCLGEIMIRERLQLNNGRQLLRFDGQHLTPGMYTYTLMLDGRMSSGKLLKLPR